MERDGAQRTKNPCVRLRRKLVSFTDSDRTKYHAFLKLVVVDIIDRYGGPDPSPFVIRCVLALSQVLGGPDRFDEALRWLATDKQMGEHNTAIEVSIMYWAGQHGEEVG